MEEDPNKRVAERWFKEIFTQGNLAVVDEIVAPDFIAHAQGGDPDQGGRELFKAWLLWYISHFTDQEWTLHDTISEDNKVVVRYSGYTSYQGGFFDIPGKGQRLLETGILIFRIEDGMVHELWSEMSDLQVAMQLGAFPPQQREDAV